MHINPAVFVFAEALLRRVSFLAGSQANRQHVNTKRLVILQKEILMVEQV